MPRNSDTGSMGGAAKRQRTCIVCGRAASKGELLRIVRTEQGSVGFDPTGKAAGRGAYVCSLECFKRPGARGRLARALRVEVTQDDCERIAASIAAIDVKDKE